MMMQTLIYALLTTSVEAEGLWKGKSGGLVQKASHATKASSFAQLAKKYERKEAGLMNAKLNSKEYMEAQDLPVAPVITSAGRAGAGSLTKWLNNVGVPAVQGGMAPGAVSLGWHYAVPRFNVNNIRFLPAKADMRLKEFTPDMHKANQKAMSLVQTFPKQAEPAELQALKKPIQFTKTVHLVREPLDHIRSLEGCLCSNTGNHTQMHDTDSYNYKWAEHWVGDLGKSRLERAANYWLKWNELAGEKATATFRVEDINESSLIESLGVQDKVKNWPLPRFKKMDMEDTTPVEMKGVKFTWKYLEESIGSELTQKIKTAAEHYGYKY